MRSRRRKRPTVRQIAELAKQQNGRCGICSMPLQASGIEIDHIIPVALGGADSRSNLRLVCAHCNRHRGARIH